jgi:hypothetical protein
MSIFTLILIVFVLFACAENKQADKGTVITDTNAGYEIELIDDEYYVVFEDEKYKNNANESQEEPYLRFSSVAEMKDKLLNGKLTSEELKEMSQFPKNSFGKVDMFDITNLNTATLPSDMTVYEVTWYGGKRYNLGIATENGDVSGRFRIHTEESYQELIKRDYDSLQNYDVLEVEEIEDRNATEYRYTTDTAKLKTFWYTIKTDKVELTVNETYLLAYFPGGDSPSETVPLDIVIYGKDSNGFFEVYLNKLTERPSVEWLSSFGLTEVK